MCNNARLTNEDGAISSRIIIIINFALWQGERAWLNHLTTVED